MILAHEHADVLLVALLALQPLQLFHDALEPSLAMQHDLAEPLGQCLPGHAHRDLVLAGQLAQAVAPVLVARLGPGVDGAVGQRALGVRYDQVEIELEGGAEAVAGRAGAQRAVEGEERRDGLGKRAVAVGAAEALGEGESLPIPVPSAGEHHSLALAFGEGRADGVGEPRLRRLADLQAVHDDEQLVRRSEKRGRAGARRLPHGRVAQVDLAAVGQDADEAQRPEVLDDKLVADLGREWQREGDLDSSGFGKLQHTIDGALDGIGVNLATAAWTEGAANARPQQPQVVVDLGGRPDRGAAGLGGVLLLDRHRRRDTLNGHDIRLLHPLQKLLGVGGERLDVAALRLGEDRVEDERRLARPRRPGHHGEGAVRDVEVDALEVVLGGASYPDSIFHYCASTGAAASGVRGRENNECPMFNIECSRRDSWARAATSSLNIGRWTFVIRFP